MQTSQSVQSPCDNSQKMSCWLTAVCQPTLLECCFVLLLFCLDQSCLGHLKGKCMTRLIKVCIGNNQQCVVPENIQTPTTEGISLRTPLPPWIFHFCRELMAPPPLRNFHKCDKDPPTPLEKFIFTKKDY